MADAVSTITILNTPNRIIRRFTNRSDATGETGVVKIDKSTLTGLEGNPPLEPAALDLEWVQWSIQGFTSVQANWDHATDDPCIIMGTGYGKRIFEGGDLPDPRSAGGTGDILFTTYGATATSTYDIVMSFKKSGSV